jgi:hypothetical protein
MLVRDNQRPGDWERDHAICDQRALALLAASAGMFGRQEAAQHVFYDCMVEHGWHST